MLEKLGFIACFAPPGYAYVIKCSQIRKRSRNAMLNNLLNQSDLDYRTHYFNLCYKEIPAQPVP